MSLYIPSRVQRWQHLSVPSIRMAMAYLRWWTRPRRSTRKGQLWKLGSKRIMTCARPIIARYGKLNVFQSFYNDTTFPLERSLVLAASLLECLLTPHCICFPLPWARWLVLSIRAWSDTFPIILEDLCVPFLTEISKGRTHPPWLLRPNQSHTEQRRSAGSPDQPPAWEIITSPRIASFGRGMWHWRHFSFSCAKSRLHSYRNYNQRRASPHGKEDVRRRGERYGLYQYTPWPRQQWDVGYSKHRRKGPLPRAGRGDHGRLVFETASRRSNCYSLRRSMDLGGTIAFP